ncbi:MAG: hypothetical protein RXO36_07610 [Candidatus Nanopusillus acidilobi]
MNKINSRKEVIMKFLVYNIHRIIKENKNIINYFLKRISTRHDSKKIKILEIYYQIINGK